MQVNLERVRVLSSGVPPRCRGFSVSLKDSLNELLLHVPITHQDKRP